MQRRPNNTKTGILQSLHGFVEANPEHFEMILDLPAVKVIEKKKNKTALVIGGADEWTSMMTMMLGENLADAVLCGSESRSFTPNDVMCTGLAAKNGDAGILFICSDDREEKEAFIDAEGLLDEADIQSKVVFAKQDTMLPSDSLNRYGVGSQFFLVKVAGAAASMGMPLEEIYRLARKTRNYTKGINVRMNEAVTYAETERALFQLLKETGIRKGDNVCVCICGYGDIHYAELCSAGLFSREVLAGKGISIHDVVIVPIVEPAEEASLQITLMQAGDGLLPYYDMPCSALYFQKC